MNAAPRQKHRSHSATFALSACLIASCALAQQNPLQAIKDTLNKAKQELQNKLPSGSSPNSGAARPASAAVQTPAAPTTIGARPATSATASGGTVFTPPADEAAKPAGPLDPTKLPDVGGVHIGMSMDETLPILKKLHPGAPVQPVAHGHDEPLSANLILVETAIPRSEDSVYVNYTLDKQIVFAVNRDTRYAQGIAIQNVIDALRKKYGPESAALNGNYPPHNDGEITKMWWLVDEQGNVLQKVKMNPDTYTPLGCASNYEGFEVISQVRSLYRDAEGNKAAATYCDSLIYLYVEVGDGSGAQIVSSTRTFLIDNALMRRSSLAFAQGLRAQSQQKKKQELQNANRAKPNL